MYQELKRLLYFLLGFALVAALMFSCSIKDANAWCSYYETNDCIIKYYEYTGSSEYTSFNTYQCNTIGADSSDPCFAKCVSSPVTASPVTRYGFVLRYYTFGPLGSSSTNNSLYSIDYDQAIDYFESAGFFPWPGNAPASCDDIPETCADRLGQVETIHVAGLYQNGPFCVDGCKALQADGLTIGVDDPTLGEITVVTVEYTGQECSGTETNNLPTDPECTTMADYCSSICNGDLSNFTCTNDDGYVVYNCGCEEPDVPFVDDGNGGLTPDTDSDTIPDTSDPDIDGDGDPNGSNDDTDGDGTINKDDKDVDNDGITNGGNEGWDADRGNPNGVGADPDVDGDGADNGTDPDIDGDGIDNGADPDADGDGVSNSGDLDSDGDGILDGADPDADGYGILNADDADPFGETTGDGDTDGDGDIDGDDQSQEEADQATLDGIEDGTYDSTIEGIQEQSSLTDTLSSLSSSNPFTSELGQSGLTLSGSNSCFDFPNPYTGGTESYCLSKYDSEFSAMGYVLVAIAGLIAFLTITG